MVYIVMVKALYSTKIEAVFSSRRSAEMYIKKEQETSKILNYTIVEEEVKE